MKRAQHPCLRPGEIALDDLALLFDRAVVIWPPATDPSRLLKKQAGWRGGLASAPLLSRAISREAPAGPGSPTGTGRPHRHRTGNRVLREGRVDPDRLVDAKTDEPPKQQSNSSRSISPFGTNRVEGLEHKRGLKAALRAGPSTG
jgi:hypothetical protein